MGEREEALAEELLMVMSVQEAESLLVNPKRPYDVAELLAELEGLQARFTAGGRIAQAALVRRLAELVAENRPAAERAVALLHRTRTHGRDRPIGFPDPDEPLSPRLRRELRITELADAGELDAALAAAREADGVPLADPGELPRVAGSRRHLAGLLRDAGRSRDALEAMAGAEFAPAAVGVHSHSTVVASLASQFHQLRGLLHEDLGDYRRGRQEYTAAAEIAVAAGDTAALLRTQTDLAASYCKSGLLREALSGFRAVLRLAESLPDQGFVPAALNNLGRVLAGLGRSEAARSCHERVLHLFDRDHLQGSSRANALIALGDLAGARSEQDAALRWYASALTATVNSRDARAGLLQVLSRLDGDSPQSRALFGDVLVFLSVAPEALDDWAVLMHCRLAEARYLHGLGRHAEAAEQLRRLGAEADQRAVDPEARAQVTLQLARSLLRDAQGRTHQEAFDLLWHARTALPPDSEVTADLTRLLVDVLVDHGQTLRLPDHRPPAELAFDLHEETRSGTFLVHLAHAPLAPPPHVPRQLVQDEAELLAELATAATSVGHVERGSQHVERREQLGRRLASVHRRMRPHAPEYVRLREARPARMADLRRHLRSRPDAEECAFVSFLAGTGSITAFVYLPGAERLTVTRIPVGERRLADAVAQLQRTFDGAPHEFPPLAPLHPRRPWRRETAFLDALTPLIAALLPSIADRPLLLVAGDGHLSALPLAAVPTPDGSVLAVRHAVVQVGSATAMLYAERRRERTSESTPREASPVFCAGVAAQEDPDPGRLEQDAELLGAVGWPVSTVHGTQATKDAVLRGLRGSRIAHLTCHGYFDTAEPLDSGVLLAHGGSRPSKLLDRLPVTTRLSHLLTARDIARTATSTDLLTLRACSTGKRDQLSGGLLEGMVQALLYAGVGNVVASLWNCNEDSSRRLLTDFYRNLAARPGDPLWRCFWAAQRNLIDRPAHPWESHPYHWAALALFGEGRQT
ncbi:CHAT domain-containing protein [Kitasatospora sp. NPDC057198]|uniref:CHAT domain-containing protein n=1 Tax=Kitasatospora sp. NPDC057198 TaxID=3346046 RepID=UPI0036404CEA